MGRGSSKQPPAYRHHKASGQAVVTIDGRDVYLGPHGSPQSFHQYGLLVAGGVDPVAKRDRAKCPPRRTLVEVMAAYWAFAEGYYVKGGKPTSELAAFRPIIADARALAGREPVDDFGPAKLKALRQMWIDRGHARSNVNKNMRRFVRMIRWAVAEELADGETLQRLRAVGGLKKGRSPAPEAPPVMPVPIEAVEATIPAMPPVLADMVRFQLLTGARPGEVCKMTPAMVDRAGDVWEYRVAGHKTEHHDRQRVVYIGPDAQAVLTPYLLRDASAVCFSMAECNAQRRAARHAARVTPLSCGNRPGKRSSADRSEPPGTTRASRESFDPCTYRQAVHYACDDSFTPPGSLARRDRETKAARNRRLNDGQKAELADWQKRHQWHPNQLRHTRGTEIRKRFGLEAAQVILGHAAADVTQVYAERDRDKAIEVARAVG